MHVIGLVVALQVVLAGALGSCESTAGCNPTGTFVESSGLHVRIHGAELCLP
jgi:hypothetical protein